MESVYVANLPPDIRIKDIDDFFRPFGKLVFIDVNHRANPVYANVQFDSARNAFNAVKARHGYDYEGYTLQLRLVENEVRNRRDAIPPQPLMFKNIDHEFGNNYNRSTGNFSSNSEWSSGNRFDVSQFPTINRPGMSQQNIGYSSNNRINMDQTSMMQFSSRDRPNVGQQFSNMNRSSMPSTNPLNMEGQFLSSNRSNMDQPFSNINRSNVSLQNNFGNRREMAQENTYDRSNNQHQYTNTSRPNIPQLKNMSIENPNNSWNIGNNDIGWNSGNFCSDNFNNNNFNNSNGNGGPNETYNQRPAYEERYTSCLSGAGVKWFNRFIRKGYSPEMARAKALEHRKVPYLRDEHKNKPIPNNPTNMALETIGNTIISLLSADQIQPGFDSNMGGNNIGPSSVVTQAQFNAASKRQYVKSLDILKMIEKKRVKTAKDRITVKYHTQIVKDYEKINRVDSRSRDEISRNTTSRNTTSRNLTSTNRTSGNSTSKKPTLKNSTAEKPYQKITSTRSEEHLRELMTKTKAKLLKSARDLGYEARGKKGSGGAYRKRTKLLMDHGFMEIEAKSLAWNHIEKLEELFAIKKEYDSVAKKTDFLPANKKILSGETKSVVYRNDLKYLEEYSKHRMKELSKTILFGLNECIKRIHDYEKSRKIPLTENKFTKLLLKITSREGFFKKSNKNSSPRKEDSDATNADQKRVKDNTETNKVDSKKSEDKKDVEDKIDNQDGDNKAEDSEVNEDNQENLDDGGDHHLEEEIQNIDDEEENQCNESEENQEDNDEVILVEEDFNGNEEYENEENYSENGNEEAEKQNQED